MAGKGKTAKQKARATEPERVIREVQSYIPETDQWSGLLIRTENNRIFFIPSRILNAYELDDRDPGLGGNLVMEGLQTALNSLGCESCGKVKNLGIKNAVLMNQMDPVSTLGMRVTHIISKEAIGNYNELLPPKSDWKPKPKPKKNKAKT